MNRGRFNLDKAEQMVKEIEEAQIYSKEALEPINLIGSRTVLTTEGAITEIRHNNKGRMLIHPAAGLKMLKGKRIL